MTQFALLIAVQKYKDASIEHVRFAEADATEFASALTLHDFELQKLLLSQDATKTTIESQIKRGLGRLTEADSFFLYYAGHGFSDNGKNFVTCYDTDPGDLRATSLGLHWIFKQLDSSKSKRVVVFLDSCESGITKIDHRRGLYGSMSESEIEEFFGQSEFKVCFSACKASESSYSDGNLKHGIWTYHLLEAIQGNAPTALERGRFLTANSLQNYLSQQVPLTLRQSRSGPAVQTPWMYGGLNRDFQIADLSPILQARSAATPIDKHITDALIRVVANLRIKNLSGFRRGHREPTSINYSTRQFVESISSTETSERAESLFSKIKSTFGYTRREIKCESGKIVTPDFEYTVSCAQHKEDPSLATLTEEITNLKSRIVHDERFNKVFSGTFDELVLELSSGIEVEKVIDAIEGSDSDEIEVEYPSDVSYCTISFKDGADTIRITDCELIIESSLKKSPKELVEIFHVVHKRLVQIVPMKLLSAK